MEVKINKEIQSYSESLFFGLSMRQCGFSLAAVLVAIGLYFLLKPYVGAETVSWMCILGAAPFAAMGFVSYHGMTAEQLVWTWFRSEILEPKRLISEPDNLYYNLLEDTISKREKEEYKA
ncbi:MAG: PrgI family protein [Clostridiales bacterium]|nr:PrgI family protein [Clostridiales bacterium]